MQLFLTQYDGTILVCHFLGETYAHLILTEGVVIIWRGVLERQPNFFIWASKGKPGRNGLLPL